MPQQSLNLYPLKIPILFCFCVLMLSACVGPQTPPPVPTPRPEQKPYSVPPPKPDSKAFYRLSEHTQCVPYARKVSGIPIRGNAHTWWYQAEGKYQRSATPKVGAVMVLSKTQRLKYGHLAVVKRVIDSRNIEVEHANWGGSRETRMIAYRRMPVVDTSKNNDWSSARFWNYPSSSYGSVYKVSGFIYPN